MKLDSTIADLTRSRFSTFSDKDFNEWIVKFAREVNFTPGRFITILKNPEFEYRQLMGVPENLRQILPYIKIDGQNVIEVDFLPIDGLLYTSKSVDSSSVSSMHGYAMSIALTEIGIDFAKYLTIDEKEENVDHGFLLFLSKCWEFVCDMFSLLKKFVSGIMLVIVLLGVFQTYDSPTFQKFLTYIVK